MQDEQSSSKSFFNMFQNANKNFDVDAIALCYADTFLFGQPQGVQTVKKEDFLRILPKRKEMMQKIGQKSSTIVSLKETPISEQYIQVEVVWKMIYQKGEKTIEDTNTATYILHKQDTALQIVVQIDHQDLMKKVQAMGLLPSE